MMIDEAVSSEEDVGDSDSEQDQMMPEILDPSKKKQITETQSDEPMDGSYYDESQSSQPFKKVIPRRRNRNHIELRDLTEGDFLDLIEAKN